MDNLTGLEKRWFALVAELSPTTPIEIVEKWWQIIASAYSEKHRHYHTLEHINFGLLRIDKFTNQFHEPKAVEFAWWFHDIVYVLKSKTNEHDSSVLAVTAAHELGLPKTFTTKVESLVMATVHPQVPEGHDKRLLHDIDISILGENWDTQLKYREKIRAEYLTVYTPDQFQVGRTNFLKEILASEFIFCTDLFQTLFEKQARENIAKELCELI